MHVEHTFAYYSAADCTFTAIHTALTYILHAIAALAVAAAVAALAAAAAVDAAAAVPDTEIEVEEDVAKAFLFDAGVSLSELVDAINAVGATPSDLVAILEALREAGALNAELIVI